MRKRFINYACKVYFNIYSLFHPIEKKVVFTSFFGKQYSDNPRAVSEKLHALYPDFEIVWILSDDRENLPFIPSYVTVINKNRKGHEELRQIATACAYVYNCELKPNIGKRRNQLYIQTWHGDLPFKKVLYDSENNFQKVEEIMDYKYTDLCVAGCENGEIQYRKAFKYQGEILRIGMPRNDKLIINDEKEKRKIKKTLGITEEKKILIYAPTFRDNQRGRQSVTVDLKKVIECLNKNEEWVCLIRAHLASEGLDIRCDGLKFIDVSSYPDLADLLSIGDLLITDYSSCAGDFIRRGKGVILAIFDKDEYEKKCRQFVFDIKESGFFTAENMDELIFIIENYREKDYSENCEMLCRRYKIFESGYSSDEICNRINKNYTMNIRNRIKV